MSQSPLQKLTYTDVEPLDWFQFKAFLWEALAEVDEGRADRWQEIASIVNAKCKLSVPQPALAYYQAFRRIASVKSAIRNSFSSPGLGQKIWSEILYECAQHFFNRPVFMNLGYVDHRGVAAPINLKEKDEPYRLFIQLYHRAVSGVSLEGRDILEVGCGSGGGSSYIMRYLKPASVVGVDLVEENIKACSQLHSVPGLSFMVGDAEALEFSDESFDAVVNIESSEHYPNMERFLGEVQRVLRLNGYFLFADLRWLKEEWGHDRTVAGLYRQLGQSGLQILKAENITANVLSSVDVQDEAKHLMLRSSRLEGNNLHHFQEIMLCKGSQNYKKLKSGNMQYWTFVCQKQACVARNVSLFNNKLDSAVDDA
jgi:ubiquinone/menaquinone biosynthesis C-methylase UbiE